jgi:hypothetical protein
MPPPLTERFVNNFATIMIARIAMIVTPFVIAIGGWLVLQIYDDLKVRLVTQETINERQASELQDHESRLKFAAERADQFAEQIERRFNSLEMSIKDLTTQMGAINGSIIRLQTTIENRLPPRQSKLIEQDPPQQ